VNDAGAVCLVQGARDLAAVAQHLLERKRPLLQAVGEGLAFDVFHDQVVETVVLADIEQRADVGMAQGSDGARLPLETGAPFG
jgi:hypothetical protein